MFRILWRLIVVCFGFFVAAISGLIILAYAGGSRLSANYRSDLEGEAGLIFNFLADVFGIFQFAVALGPALTLVPAVGLIIVGEVARIRSVIYYLLAGGAAFLAMPLLYETGDGISGSISTPFLLIFSAGGFVAGFFYWLIAGRGAGVLPNTD